MEMLSKHKDFTIFFLYIYILFVSSIVCIYIYRDDRNYDCYVSERREIEFWEEYLKRKAIVDR